MNRQEAQKTLEAGMDFVNVLDVGDEKACLDGWFTADQLEAIAYAMRHPEEFPEGP